MVSPITPGESLQRLLAGLTEQTFTGELGVVDPLLVDYLADLLYRFMRIDALYRVRDIRGKRLQEVADMLQEAEARRAKPRREAFRHIGDFTLFWTGLFPEALSRLQAPHSKDHLLDYCEQGKRSYYIASTFDEEPYCQEAPVLRRLSDHFELCTAGLQQVRAEWEKLPDEFSSGTSEVERN